MATNFIDFMACLSCHGELTPLVGDLCCSKCKQKYIVEGGIARFVESESYSASFGLQWNSFSKAQLDSHLGTHRSRSRFEIETGWTAKEIENEFILDAGCGAGRFSEVALEFGAKLISIDYSTAIDVTFENLKDKGRIFAIQADLQSLPIRNRSLNYIYCIGVLQHTQFPSLVLQELTRILKIGGTLVVSYYPRTHWYTKLYSKYLIRPITRRLPKKLLLRLVVLSSRVWFPITTFLFSLPMPWRKLFRFLIPIANYPEFEYRNEFDQRTEAVLDTFDMLSPQFDHPFTQLEISNIVAECEGHFSLDFISGKEGTIRLKRIK